MGKTREGLATASEESEKKSCCRLHEDEDLGQRLNEVGLATSFLDSLIDILSSSSSVVNSFLADVVPYYVTSLFYLVPPVIPFLPNILGICFDRWKKKPSHSEAEKAASLIELFKKREQIQTAFDMEPQLEDEFIMGAVEHFKEEKQEQVKENTINFSINLTYNTLRILQGIIIVMEGAKATSTETRDDATSWLERISSVINLAYMAVMLKSYHSSKKKSTKKQDIPLTEVSQTLFAPRSRRRHFAGGMMGALLEAEEEVGSRPPSP